MNLTFNLDPSRCTLPSTNTVFQVRRPRGDTLQPMAPTLNFSNVEEKYGSKWFFYHRVDMHNHLKEIPATIRLGSQVMDIDPDAGIIILKDDTEIQKDLIVVADGQHVSSSQLFLPRRVKH